MQLTFRAISYEDAEALVRLSLQFGYSVSVDEMQHRITQLFDREDHCGLVALVELQVVGWIHASHVIRLETESFVEIGGLVVEEKLRRQGIGLQLIERVKAWAAAKSVKKVRVRCNTKRAHTHTFYRKLGFTESKEQKVFDLIL